MANDFVDNGTSFSLRNHGHHFKAPKITHQLGAQESYGLLDPNDVERLRERLASATSMVTGRKGPSLVVVWGRQ